MFPLHEPLSDTLRDELREYDDLIAALLVRRGVNTKEAAAEFLNPSFDLHVHDPLLMFDMPKAARRFADAILNKEKIVIWSDYDCDGVPGGVVLHDFLKKAEANFENYIPHRHLEGYGMNVAGVETVIKNGAKLIVTVDSGITDAESVARAKELGADVIVTDHHLPGETLPDAFAVVNPNARKEEAYPFHELCGTGVAWKLVCATLAIEPKLREVIPVGWEKWLLDMVALATVADMVSLKGENRVLVKYGLTVMHKSPRIGLQKLCRAIRLEQNSITEDDIGFSIAPRINAASRVGEAIEAFRLLSTSDENEAEMLAKKLEKLNRQRKAESGAITREVHARIKGRGEIRSVIALGDPEWRPALLGLVANTIADEFERPVFLWGREGSMRLKGSMRSGGPTHAIDLMRAAGDVFLEFGGHAAAGGFTVNDELVFSLEDRLVAAFSKLEQPDVLQSFLRHADAEISEQEVTPIFLQKLERLSPFGMQNEKPVFLLREWVVKDISRFGKAEEHLKLKITAPLSFGRDVDAVTFFAKGTVARAASELKPGSVANIIGHLERDTFSRKNPVRLRLLDLKLV